MHPDSDPVAGTGKWLWRLHDGPARGIRLIVFPHAGGSAGYYHSVSAALADSVDVLAVQYPGRQNRSTEPCIDTIDELARRTAAELMPLTGRPLAFFGHSMGAAVAFEVARLLHRRGAAPEHLFVSSRPAPTVRRPDRRLRDATDQAILDEVCRVSGADPAVLRDESLRSLIMPALRTDYRAIETYRFVAGPPLPCPITALVGDADPTVAPGDVYAWQEQTDGPFVAHVLPGGHFYFDGRLPELTGRITAALLHGDRQGVRP